MMEELKQLRDIILFYDKLHPEPHVTADHPSTDKEDARQHCTEETSTQERPETDKRKRLKNK